MKFGREKTATTGQRKSALERSRGGRADNESYQGVNIRYL